MSKHTYVLGTGVSHDGSACLLKDGKICVAIEKERLTRQKHDGGNDSEAIRYCLDAEGISIEDVDLIVQNSNFGSFKFGSGFLRGPRLFSDNLGVPIVTISHHLAHAYSTVGTCPFRNFNVIVMDGCGNSYDDCIDRESALIFDEERVRDFPHLHHEKDSYYCYSGDRRTTMVKDFSVWGYSLKNYPLHPGTNMHSIGGLYAAVSTYCFRNLDDSGKLMGLAPYGRPGVFDEEVFELKDGRVFVNYNWMEKYRMPATSYEYFKENFQYYADIAYGVQKEVERAILYVIHSRLEFSGCDNLCYSGGTALNAVANNRVLAECKVKNLYIEPAAGDNGLSIGCAYYGWLEVLERERVMHNGSTCFGKCYPVGKIKEDLELSDVAMSPEDIKTGINLFFENVERSGEFNSGASACIRFDISGFGITDIAVNGRIECLKNNVASPTCIINSNSTDFFKLLLYPKSFWEMIGSEKISVSNRSELNSLLERFDLEKFALTLRTKMVASVASGSEGIHWHYSHDYIREAAQLLAGGKIIGWFQDGSEFGPRALGRRSILADPRNPDVRSFINSNIKFREDFRPFAPSVLREDVASYFRTDRESPYMILIDKVLDSAADKIQSVVHKDNTCRIQTVTREWNEKFYQLIGEFKEITGVAVLLNTSFNKRGMPIVETPREAIDFFMSCDLDYLVIDKFIVGKK